MIKCLSLPRILSPKNEVEFFNKFPEIQNTKFNLKKINYSQEKKENYMIQNYKYKKEKKNNHFVFPICKLSKNLVKSNEKKEKLLNRNEHITNNSDLSVGNIICPMIKNKFILSKLKKHKILNNHCNLLKDSNNNISFFKRNYYFLNNNENLSIIKNDNVLNNHKKLINEAVQTHKILKSAHNWKNKEFNKLNFYKLSYNNFILPTPIYSGSFL